MSKEKNPHAVSLGRDGGKIGGKSKSKAKKAASRANGAKRVSPYTWRLAMCRAADLVRHHGKACMGHSLSFESMAFLIASEPPPKKGKKS